MRSKKSFKNESILGSVFYILGGGAWEHFPHINQHNGDLDRVLDSLQDGYYTEVGQERLQGDI